MKKKTQKSWPRRSLLSGLMLGLIALGSGWSGPALALCPTNDSANNLISKAKAAAKDVFFGESLANMAEIISTIGTTISSMQDAFDDLLSEEDLISAANTAADAAQTQTNILITDAKANAFMHTAKTAANMRHVMEHAPPRNQYLCRKIMLHQLATTTQDFEDAISTMAEQAIASMYRGEGADGNGPQYFSDAHNQRCKYRYGSPVDGYPASCVDTETKVGPAKRTFVDADLSPFTMDGTVTLEMPRMTSRSYKLSKTQSMVVTVADPQNDEQRMWIAALNYCYTLAGPRPSPPYGDALSTPAGGTDMTTYLRGLAMQSPFVRQCTDMLAHYTRPNADTAESKKLIEDQNTMCKSLIGKEGVTSLVDKATIDEKLGGCAKGLSPFQAEYAEHISCKSSMNFVMTAHSGANHPPMMDAAVSCGTGWNLWKSKLMGFQSGLVESVRGQMKVKEIWAQMSSARAIGMAALGFDRDLSRYSFLFQDNQPWSEPKPVHTVKAVKKQADSIVPRHADEGGLPEVVDP